MWMYNETLFVEDLIEDNVGFVYLIINHQNKKKYIGKKLFKKSKTYQKNKKKKRKKVDSNWIKYFGSNKELQEDVRKTSIDKIERIILRLCKSKSEMSYFETKYIFENDCLLSDYWYNSWVSCRINKNTLNSISYNMTGPSGI